jgi:hypothetical protein
MSAFARNLQWEERLPPVAHGPSDEMDSSELRRPGGYKTVERAAIIRMPHLEVGAEDVHPGQSFDASFHLDTELPEGTDRWAPAVFEAPSAALR